MIKILKYTFADLRRSRWSYIYFAFYLALGFALLFLNHDLSKAVITLMNVIVVLTPMIGTLFGIMYFYQSREFIELLLAQPIQRPKIFLGIYLGVAFSLTLSLVMGLGIPFLIYGLWQSAQVANFMMLLVSGSFLTFIFIAIAINIGLFNANRIKGFGYALLAWLFFAVIYDAVLLISLILLSDYPLDSYSLVASLFNPIDLSRILILLHLDISALMGYTGALFQQFFGTHQGLLISIGVLILWLVVLISLLIWKVRRKDF